MKKVKRRAAAAALLAAIALALLGAYIVSYFANGEAWAGFRRNPDGFSSGVINSGTVTDREGQVLWSVRNGQAVYSDDPVLRTSCLHLTGDRQGNTGTAAYLNYGGRLLGWDLVNGISPGGGTLALSILAGLQTAAWEALDGRRGAVAVINYETGEILCCVSSPSFDPDGAEEPEDGAYLNRVLSGLYTPGSVYKLVTLTAALETLDGVLERDFECTGELSVGGGRVTCGTAHGKMKLEDALAVSCNCVFGQLALELGPETMADFAERLGMTVRLPVDSMESSAGSYGKAPEGSLGLAWSGAGQHEDLVTPIAMARLAAAIASGGVAPDLTLLRRDGGAGGTRIMDSATAGRISDMMDYAVARTYGDGNFPGLDLHAKSGTAEVGGARPNAWFTGLITNPGHPYAFAVCVEDAGYGASVAAPAAYAVLSAALGAENGGDLAE